MNNLKILRKKKEVSQSEVAEYLDVSRQAYNNYETGKREPSQTILLNLANYFDVSIDCLLGRKSIEEEENQKNIEKFNEKDEKDIAKKLENALADLERQQDGLMFDGEPLDPETSELMKISLENSIRLAKSIAKKKYTPNKYKN